MRIHECGFCNERGLQILREVLNISDTSFNITIRIFSRMNEKKCLNFWSDVTKIPKPLIKVRLNDGSSSGKTEHGICRVTIKKGQAELKLMHALTSQISKQVLNQMPL